MPAMNQLLQEGRYRINHQFASNGQAAVYDAYDTVRETNVLVKEVNVKLNRVMTTTQQEQLKLAFANQARVLTEIKHDALFHLHDFFSEVGRQYLVMESLEGEELSDMIANRDVRYSLDDMLVWADQILDGLSYLHRFSPPVIHKNIKPNHIKLTAGGKVKLLAFGLADGSDTKISTNLATDLSKEEIAYSPLEQIWDDLDPASQKVISNSYDERSEKSLLEPLDSRSDIYSFGATFYHLLTGRKPIDALERSIEMLDGKHDPLTPPHELKASIPPEVSDVIMKAMEVKREDRFDSAAILRQILRTAMIRAREREDIEEVNEEREAAEAIRIAGQTRNLKGQNPLDKHNPFEEKQAEPRIESSGFPTPAANNSSPNIHVSQDAIRAAVLEQKLREAEEQRKAAEERAAEIERILKEKESMLSMPDIKVDEGLLDLGTTSNPGIRPLNQTGKLPKLGTFAFERNQAKDEILETAVQANIQTEVTIFEESPSEETAASHQHPERSAAKFDAFEAERFISSQSDIDLTETQFPVEESPAVEINYETAIDQTPSGSSNAAFEADRSFYVERPFETDVTEIGGENGFASGYYETEPQKTSLPLPLILGGAGVVLLVIVGGIYLLLSGSSSKEAEVQKQMIQELESTKPAETPEQVTQQPEVPAAAPEPENSVTVETPDVVNNDEQNASLPERRQASTEQPAERRNAATAPTPAKQRRPAEAPARQPSEPRRTVTVDDLIRDN